MSTEPMVATAPGGGGDEDDGPSASTWAQARGASHQLILQAALEDLESKAAKLEEELHASKRTVESQESQISALREDKTKLQASLETESSKRSQMQLMYEKESSQHKSLEERQRTESERMQRLQAEGDNLRDEISRLTKSNNEYREKVVQMETQAKLGDSEVVPLKFQVERLKNEIDSISGHNQWLNTELNSKNEQLSEARKKHSAEISQMRSDFDESTEDQQEMKTECSRLQRQLAQLEAQNERTAKELREARDELATAKADSEISVQRAERLTKLQQDQLLRLQQKHDTIATQLEAVKQHALAAEQESNQELQLRQHDLEQKSKEILQNQANAYQNQISELEAQLEEANRRRKEAEDGILSTDTSSRRLLVAGSSFGRPALTLGNQEQAADGAVTEMEPLNLTEIYSRLAETEDALAAETLRRKKAEIMVERIKVEIENSAPMYLQQRKEFEEALKRLEEYKKRLGDALDEAKAAREESLDVQAEMGRLRTRNNDLEEETKELAKQVQTMLIARSTGGALGTETPDASIVQMQATNQRLLGEVRRMRNTIRELETKMQSDNLSNKVEVYERDLVTLRDERKRQEVMVESIVQQRDLYRALLAKQDSNLVGSPSEEASALQMVKAQSERSKLLAEEKNKLQLDLAKARSELSSVDREKEAASERMARYEALNSELTKSLDAVQADLSASKAETARCMAEAAFHREKTGRLEESLERSRNETARVTSAKNELQRINFGLQDAVSKANADASQMEGDLQQAQMKVRLAETQAESAKAAEHRLAGESKQLRNEISRQGALIESIQRIEASLSAKTAAEEESLKSQISSLNEELSAAASKHSLEIEKLNGQVSDQNTKMQDLEHQRGQATKEMLDAKKELLAISTKLQKMTKKATVLEEQLRAAQKKLGETGDDIDVEADLRTKIASLTEELESKVREVKTLKERSATYERLAKENENALSDQNAASGIAKKTHEQELANLKEQVELATTEATKGKEIIKDLTNDLSLQREERSAELQEVNKRVAELEGQVEQFKKDADSAQNQYAQIESEVIVLRADVANAQNNYERELALHATARTDLRQSKEETQTEKRLRKAAEEQAETLRSEAKERDSVLVKEKLSVENTLKEYEKNLKETRAQNALLHGQLDKIGEQIEKMQGGKGGDLGALSTDAGASDEVVLLHKTVTELREVVKFVRSEKEMIQAQLDSARRAAERERAAAEVAKRSLDEARAELKVAQDNIQGSISGAESDFNGLKEKFQSAETQNKLLGESNSHLREEVKKLESALKSVKGQFDEAKAAAVPSEKRQRALETEKASYLAEKESLLREINDWKGRVQSLVSKFNQIDPAEHAKVVKKAESLENQVKEIEKKRKEAEDESKRIRGLAQRASKELMQNKSLVETHKKTISKLTNEKEALERAQKEGASKKDYEEAKQKLAKLEKERADEKIQLTGAQEMNDKLRDRLRQFQKTIGDMKKKDMLLTKELKDTKILLEKTKSSPASGDTAGESKKTGSTKNDEAPSTDSKVAASAATGDDPLRLSSASPKPLAEKKTEKASIPKVPPGGFKFAASPQVSSKSASKTSSSAESSKPSNPSASSGSKVTASKKRPAESLEAAAELKKAKAPETKIFEKPSESNQTAGEQAVAEAKKNSDSTTEGGKTAQRRGSGEKKELSMKEKLLEKKRRLMEAMQKQKQELKTKDGANEEPASKKTKVQASPSMKEKKEVVVAQGTENPTSKDSAISEVAGTSTKEQDNQNDDGEVQNTNDSKEVGEGSKETTGSSAASSLRPTANPFNPFGGAGSSGKSAFGSASASTGGFGQLKASTGSGFGQVAKAPAFGQGSSFGSGGGFGSSGSVFGAKSDTKASGVGSTLGSGAAFLNMKPPGSSTSPPRFSFGTSGSITLPTPANPSPQASMFNAFSTGSSSASFSAKPLFGSKNEKKEEGEEGEMEEESKNTES